MKNHIHPPRLAARLFEWYCEHAMVEDLYGDLEESFYADLRQTSVRRARFRYWVSVLSLIFSYAVRKRKRNAAYPAFAPTNNLAMFKNYFKVSVRSLAKHKFFTIINVLGLAFGMSISLLLIAMISYVSRYDNFHTNHDRLYRVISHTVNSPLDGEFASTPTPLAAKLKHEVAGIDHVIRINATLSLDALYNNRKLPLKGFFVDPEFLRAFTFPLEKGNAATALGKPNSILITQRAAGKFFGSEDPIGKTVTLGNLGEFEVTGLLRDIPKNSHMQFEVLCPYAALEMLEQQGRLKAEDNAWEYFRNSYIYMLLPAPLTSDKKADIEQFMAKASAQAYPHSDGMKASFEIQALDDIVMGNEPMNQIGPEWGWAPMSIFALLTLMILVPACFNYTTISISRALKRAKEIGLRKVVGGQRNHIFLQFIIETVLITLVALVGSWYIFYLIKGEFSSMIVAAEYLDFSPDITTIAYFIAFAVAVGLMAGLVPALYFSRLNPIQALKNKIATSGAPRIRKILIVTQFALSLGFIMSVAILIRQQYTTINYDFGFNQENILDVELQGVNPEIFKTQFDAIAEVQDISMSSYISGTGADPLWLKKPESPDSVEVFQMFVDHRYLDNLGLKLLAGKNFPEQAHGRENWIIVNEAFLKRFKLASYSEALEKSFVIPGAGEVRILGIVKDFHYTSLREPISSFCFRYNPGQYQYANLKVSSTDIISTLGQMETIWKKIGGETKFKAQFMDDEIQDTYSSYFALIKMCGFLGLMAVSISCLGLLGMVVYSTETRTKEVGVRKVMGATTSGLALLLSKEYLKMMGIASLIAIPITYLLFDKILLSMQYYRSPIGVLEVMASVVLMLILGGATILSQTLKAARANPVDTLRYE